MIFISGCIDAGEELGAPVGVVNGGVAACQTVAPTCAVARLLRTTAWPVYISST